jgi:hypothetical protein
VSPKSRVYPYKRPKVVPGKPDPEAQRAFLAEKHEAIKENKGAEDPIVTAQ